MVGTDAGMVASMAGRHPSHDRCYSVVDYPSFDGLIHVFYCSYGAVRPRRLKQDEAWNEAKISTLGYFVVWSLRLVDASSTVVTAGLERRSEPMDGCGDDWRT